MPTHSELNAALGAPAFIDPLEIPLLCKYAADATRIVEIGAAWGASASLFLMNMPDGAHLSSIDNFSTDPQGGWQSSYGQCINAVYRALATFGYLHRFKDWSLIAQTSQYVAEHWAAPTPIDTLYIDGDHSEAGVGYDWFHWTPFVRKGGVVMHHDSRQPEGTPNNEYVHGYAAPTNIANWLRKHEAYELLDEAFSMTVWRKKVE